MNAQIEPFEVRDLLNLDPEDRYVELMPRTWALGTNLGEIQNQWAWTMWSPYGQPVGCLGIMANGYAWALLSRDMKKYMVRLTRATRDILDAHVQAKGPVYATIDDTYAEAIRWAKLLGFRRIWASKWRYDGSTTSQASQPQPDQAR